MAKGASSLASDTYSNFGDLLKFVRRRERLTQLELSIAVGYSEAQISRLEKNQRLPDLTALKALFIPALHLEKEPELAVRLLDLAESARLEDSPAPGIAPYKGLLFFDQSDADWFFGREALTTRLVERINAVENMRPRLLAVVGASGSGKSSVVRSGLAVTLKRDGWDVRVFTPTAQPLKMLETCLTGTRANGESNGARTIVIVDQFEEVFTLCHDEGARAAFVEQLLASATSSLTPSPESEARQSSELSGVGGRGEDLTVVISLRADFYSHCAQFPQLRQAISAQQEYIGQMSPEELGRAIEEPARRGGWEIEPGLVEIMLRDIGTDRARDQEPGALPLLSHALLATWEHRRGRTMTREGYRATGGVRGAIAETAESVFTDQFNLAQQEFARTIFLRLTELGEGTEDTRRRAALNELVPRAEEAAQVRAVLNTLADARLVSLGEDTAEVAHEALIREWQRLREWLNQDREGLRLHRQLTEAAREWELLKREAGALYRGARLAQTVEWASTNRERINELERAFLDASIELERREQVEREAQRQRELQAAQKLVEEQRRRAEEQVRAAKSLRRRAYLFAGAFILAIVLALTALFFGDQARQSAVVAQTNARIAFARELAANAMGNLDVDPERSVLLALQAVETTRKVDETVLPEAEDALHRAVMASRLRLTLRGHEDRVVRVAFNADGTRIATSDRSVTRLWDAATGNTIYSVPGVLMRNSWQDPSRFATSELDKNKVALHFWNANTGKELSSMSLETSSRQFASLAISPDLTRLAVGYRDGTLEIRDATNGQLLSNLAGHKVGVVGLIFSPDGKWIASHSDTPDHSTIVWDVVTGRERISLPGQDVGLVRFTRDSTRLVTASTDNVAHVWDTSSGKEVLALYGHANWVYDIAFSPDGTRMATTSWDRTAKVWDAMTGRLLFTLSGHQDFGWAIEFSPDGQRIVTGSLDKTAKVWDGTLSSEVFTVNAGGRLSRGSMNAAGTRLVTGAHSVKVWDISHAFDTEKPNAKLLVTLRKEAKNIDPLYSPDGNIIATSTWSGAAKVWDAVTGKEMYTLPDGESLEEENIAFSPDGRRLALTTYKSSNCCVLVWDLQNGGQLLRLDGESVPTAVTFTPDGKQLVLGNLDGTISIRDATSGNLLQTFKAHTNLIWDVRYSPDGKRVITSSRDATAKVWDAATWKEIFILRGHTSTIERSEYSRDGTRIVTASNDGTAKIWDAATGREVLTLYGSPSVSGALFSPEGNHVITTSVDGGIRVYLLRIQDLIALAKTRVTRTLTAEECQKFLHTQVCPPSS